MATFKVLEMGNGTSKSGKSYKKLKIEGPDGNHNVNIFPDFPNYANITFGSTIDGTIEQNGQYENIRSTTQTRAYEARGFNKEAQITKVMDKKAENIEKAQENRSEGVKISATMRDAVQCAIVAYGKDPTRLNTLEDEIICWRKWLWKHWDDPTTDAIYPD